MKKITAFMVLVLWLVAGVPEMAAADPPAGALLWFKADAGVVESGGGVQTWQDQSGNGNDAQRVLGTMRLTTGVFPAGERNVIRFNKDGFFTMVNHVALRVPDLTIFAVVEETLTNRRTIFSTYSNAINWGYGVNLDMDGAAVRSFTSAGTQATISDWLVGSLEAGYHCITNTISSTTGSKSLYADGSLLGTVPVPGLAYHTTSGASIGTLGDLPIDSFYYQGDIAEILVYPTTDSSTRGLVEKYLLQKYFLTPEPACAVTLPADLNFDCVVNFADFAVFAEQWLGCTRTDDPVCQSYIELAMAKEWIKQAFTGNNPTPPILFIYNGISSSTFLPSWNFSRTKTELDPNRTQWTLVYTEPAGNLKVTCTAIEYHDYLAVEWVTYFENIGASDTPIIENIQALADDITTNISGDFVVRYSHGCNQLITDFKLEDVILASNVKLELGCSGGRSSSALLLPPETDRAKSVGVMPYFNLSLPDDSGIMMAVGWSGQWDASFTKTGSTTVNVQAGMELTHLKLTPGEKIRTPAMLFLFWSGGDDIHGHNQFRRLLLDHYSPRPGGLPAEPPVAASPHGTIGFCDSTATSMIQGINNVADHLPPVDTWWIDAGWYSCLSIPNVAPWNSVGTWEPDPVRYPNGMKQVADAAHARGLKFLLWFEVERAVEQTWVYNNHPEWLLHHGTLPPDVTYQDPFYLVNFGNPAALAWAKDTFSQMIRDVGIDIYRIDLNMDPLYYWRNGEAADRQGINEIKHITGWYEYLDTLMLENPDLLIDNCAGGGRRLDFEMVRRSVSLTPSDYLWEPVGEQAMTYALSMWIPLHGIGSVSLNPYDCRSGMGTSFVSVFDFYNSPSMWTPATIRLNEYNAIKDFYWGDFHPLTAYSVSDNVWMAWQFDRPDMDAGMVQAFRRSGSATSSAAFQLRGLESAAIYTITNMDVPGTTTMSGAALMIIGLPINISAQPGSAIITYEKQ